MIKKIFNTIWLVVLFCFGVLTLIMITEAELQKEILPTKGDCRIKNAQYAIDNNEKIIGISYKDGNQTSEHLLSVNNKNMATDISNKNHSIEYKNIYKVIGDHNASIEFVLNSGGKTIMIAKELTSSSIYEIKYYIFLIKLFGIQKYKN